MPRLGQCCASAGVMVRSRSSPNVGPDTGVCDPGVWVACQGLGNAVKALGADRVTLRSCPNVRPDTGVCECYPMMLTFRARGPLGFEGSSS